MAATANLPFSMERGPTRHLVTMAARCIVACVTALMVACASLPAEVAREASHAVPVTRNTVLGAVALDVAPSAELSGFRMLPTPDFAFDARVQLIERAQQSLDLQYYLIQDDASGRQILRLLRDAGRRGVRVRVLIDDLYTSGEDDFLLGLAAHENIEVRLFNPFPGGRRHIVSRFVSSLFDVERMQRRTHNKLLVADGAFAIVGGRNIGDEYFGRSGVTRVLDLDAIAAGALVPQLSGIFDSYWNSALAYPVQAIVPSGVCVAQRQREFDKRVGEEQRRPLVDGKDALGQSSVGEQLRTGSLELVWARAEAVADSPRKAFGSSDERLRQRVRRRVREATKEVEVTTPYLVPGPAGMETIQLLRDRGVQFTLVTNSLASTDVPLAYEGYMRYREEMLRQGVKIYEVVPQRVAKSHRFVLPGRSRGSLHAKSGVIDGRTVLLGSMNLDPRSDARNTEMGVFIDSPELARMALALLDIVKRDAAFEVRLTDGGAVEWRDPDPQPGDAMTYREEPETSAWTRFLYRLVIPLIPESWL